MANMWTIGGWLRLFSKQGRANSNNLITFFIHQMSQKSVNITFQEA